MGTYENFESIKDLLGYGKFTTEEIIERGLISEKYISEIERRMEEAAHLLCHFPIGYTYDKNKTSHYRIALSEQFQILKEYPAGTSILDFIALDTEEIVSYLKNMYTNIHSLILEKADTPDKDGFHLHISDITKNAVASTLNVLHKDNFFLFLINCCFLQYVTEVFIYNFYPFIALKHYKKILGDAFYYDESTDYLKADMKDNEDRLYDINKFIDYGIRMTTKFIDYQKDLLTADFDMLMMKDKLFAEYDTLQYLYLMESKDNMRDTYTSTSFNTHLMPVGLHKFNHLDVVNRIIDENMAVREVCDMNSVQDWFRYEFMYLAKGNVLYKQCKNCGRFFIPSGRSDSEYCERIDTASGKTCKEVGAINTFVKKHENDEIHQAYTKAYRRMDSRKRTMYISKKEFTEWSKTAREKRKLCEDGQISLEEFQAWLDESKCR
ncbi:MAG: DUF6076 domain-containing protein [Lachnospiraceae bacterium]